MGDLITQPSLGSLHFVAKRAFEDLAACELEPLARAGAFASLARLNTLYMIARAGSGHLGSSFSSLDIVTWLYLFELRRTSDGADSDFYFSSKGHDAPGLYSVLLGLGELPFEQLHQLRRLGGLPGHPDVHTPGMVTNTGSLGMGISKAKGMLLARRLQGKQGRAYVMLGDGELQEGQIWESLLATSDSKFCDLTVIVDHNKLQSDTWVSATRSLGDLERKFAAFDWHVQRIDGHDFEAIGRALQLARAQTERPQVIIADTIKGKGVSFMQGASLDSDVALYKYHSGAPSADDYSRAAGELIETARQVCVQHRIPFPEILSHAVTQEPVAGRPERLISAYSEALRAELARVPNALVLDADLLVDTGQLPSKQAFPERHVECGIAEMDMVSQAGGLALQGMLPICHSFACFLSTRPNEQIYNNATERTRIVYVASLAGVIPGGPGHSHQGVRDIASLGSVPGLTMIEPATEAQVFAALHYAVHCAPGSSYLRLVSIPWEVPTFFTPSELSEGQGHVVREGSAALIFGYGPVLLGEALRAAESLSQEGYSVGVVNMPWLNRVQERWFAECVAGIPCLVFLDNHYESGGQGDLLCKTAARMGLLAGVRVRQLGLRELPVCGTPREVLEHHGLDSHGIARAIRQELLDSDAVD